MAIQNDNELINRNPIIGLIMGTPEGIVASEAAGARQMVNSAQLPAEGGRDIEKVGGKVIGSTAGDPIFLDVELPDGWRKELTDHSMWTSLDDKGRPRASIFYKAAFYDRNAHMSFSRRYSSTIHAANGNPDDRYGDVEPIVGVVMDNADGSVIFRSEPFEYGGDKKPWDVRDAASKTARAFLAENYPDWENDFAYWD